MMRPDHRVLPGELTPDRLRNPENARIVSVSQGPRLWGGVVLSVLI